MKTSWDKKKEIVKKGKEIFCMATFSSILCAHGSESVDYALFTK